MQSAERIYVLVVHGGCGEESSWFVHLSDVGPFVLVDGEFLACGKGVGCFVWDVLMTEPAHHIDIPVQKDDAMSKPLHQHVPLLDVLGHSPSITLIHGCTRVVVTGEHSSNEIYLAIG